MLGKVIIENGQKKIQALTADTGIGAPVGSYLYLEKKSNPQGYLYCDGSTFDETVYPALYQYLGTNVLPDWREFSAVGAEQNTTSSVIATHDVFTQGEEKDDCLQDHAHKIDFGTSGTPTNGFLLCVKGGQTSTDAVLPTTARTGAVTRGKSRAVFIYIKATSGLTENQQENVLNTINENNSYSTEEHPTGKKWIDGKPIYRKVYTGTVSNNSQIPLNISNLERVTKLDGVLWYIANNLQYILQLNNPTDSGYFTRCNIDASERLNFIMGGWNTINAQVIVEYTKTTD